MLRFHSVFVSVVAVILVCSSPANAQSTSVNAWNGEWRSAEKVTPAIEIRLVDGKFEKIVLDGMPKPVTDVQVSPDEKTVNFTWEGGQGTLFRTQERKAEVSLFAPKLSVRNAPVTRQN